MINVLLYIYDASGEPQRIELFNDEKISVTSNIQNVNDISKVFTDFSQSFTIQQLPITTRYLSIGMRTHQTMDSMLELEKMLTQNQIILHFDKGKVQLEKASYKDGKIDNYQITFFGSLVSLKDAFGGKFLKDLDLSAYNFSYTGNVVKNRVIGGAGNDVMFPLISSKNVWQFGGGGVTTNN